MLAFVTSILVIRTGLRRFVRVEADQNDSASGLLLLEVEVHFNFNHGMSND